MSLLHRTPFFRLLLALVAGIVLFQYFRIPVYILVVAFVLSLVLISALLIIRNSETQFRFGWLFGVGVFMCFFCISYVVCLLHEQKNQFSAPNNKALYEVELITAPVAKNRSYAFHVKLLRQIDSVSTMNVNGKAIVYLQKDSIPPSLLLGDRILINAAFQTPDGVQNPSGFDYATYLKRQGIGATTYVATGEWKKSGQNTRFSVTRFANQCRNHLLDIFKRHRIEGEEFAVLAALTLGYTDSLEPDLYKLYSHTGAVHILSVSGLHVGIVYVAIFALLGFLRRNRKQQILRAVIAILFIWVYAVITGLSPAVLRAAMMMSFFSLGTCLNRSNQTYNTILLSAFVILILNPNLLFNIGFQLSYSAVLSIVIFHPSLLRLVSIKSKPIKWFWSLTAVSLAAQLGTAPISIYYFNQFPNYFLLTNYVAIPLSTGIIYLAILLLFISFVPFVAGWVAFVLKWSIWLMNYCMEVIMELPASVSVISIGAIQLFCILAALILLTVFAFNKKFAPFILGLAFVFVFFADFAFRQYRCIKSSRLVVYSDSRTPIVNFIRGKDNYVYTHDQLRAENVVESYWRASLLRRPQFISKDSWFEDGFAVFQGKRIMILDNDWLRNKTSAKRLDVDYLVLTNRLKPRMDDLLSCVNPKQIIVDKSISPWYTNHVKEACQTNGIGFYSIAEQGAFMEEL